MSGPLTGAPAKALQRGRFGSEVLPLLARHHHTRQEVRFAFPKGISPAPAHFKHIGVQSGSFGRFRAVQPISGLGRLGLAILQRLA